MEKWFVPEHMKQLAGLTVRNFGYDQTNTVEYQFNKYGFRNTYNSGSSINIIGNSVSFGIGLRQSFGDIISQSINLPCNNLSLGCYLHENHDYISNLQQLIDRDCDDIFVIQINNLDRLRDGNAVITGMDKITARDRFLDYFDQIHHMLNGRRLLLVYWDNQDYDLPQSIVKKIAIFNQFHLDNSINHQPYTFGMQSHRAIAKTLTYLINANKFYYSGT
jgi:hypothetical protein